MKVKVKNLKNAPVQNSDDFTPFKLNIKVETPDDLRALYLRFNLDAQNIADHYGPKGKGHICPTVRTTDAYRALKEMAQELGVELRNNA